MPGMRILGLYQHPEHVCFRYRLKAFRAHLVNAGHVVHFRGWPRWWLLENQFIQDLHAADLVIIQRRLLSPWQLQRVRQAARLLAFDFDDAVFVRDSYSSRGLDCELRRVGFARMVAAADIVVAGNEFLREQALEWTSPERVCMVPTCVNPDTYACADHAPDNATTQLVWIGSASTLRGLEKIGDWLEVAGQNITGLNLKIICDRSLRLRQLPICFCPWTRATEATDLAGADIGISWLPSDTWSEGKCGLKILQYMAAGLPVVANSVGVQAELVRHGETGLLADTREEWQAALRLLAGDPQLRKRMGTKGRSLVERAYHVKQGAGAWLEILKTFCHTPVAALPQY